MSAPGSALVVPSAHESWEIFTPLGIRFWDPARDAPVIDGLAVTSWAPGARSAAVRAFQTRSGIYAFQGLYGLHDLEHPAPGVSVASPPSPLPFVVEVADTLGRFLPVAFKVLVPSYGIYPEVVQGSPPSERLPGLYLFSAPSRRAGPNTAVVRAQLVEQLDAVNRRPAAHAVLEVRAPGQPTWLGLADENGSVVVMFPYPRFSAPAGSGSPLTSSDGGARQRWPVTIGVRYSPSPLVALAGSALPDLRSILSQMPGVIWPSLVGGTWGPAAQLSADLVYGEELVARTDEGSALLIAPASSPL